MKNLSFISVNLLLVFLLYFGCKEDGQLASSITSDMSKNTHLEGKWVIDSLNVSSVAVPSFCYKIGSGATFDFTENDSLKVYQKDALEPCDMYFYTIQDDFIQLAKDDMIMLMEYELIDEKRLMLKSKSFFRWQEDDDMDSLTHQTLLKEGVTVFLSKM